MRSGPRRAVLLAPGFQCLSPQGPLRGGWGGGGGRRGCSLLTQGWGAGRGRLTMCSPALPPSPLGRTGRLEPLGSVIGSGRGDRVSDPLAQTKGSLLSVERGERSGLAVDNASCPAGKSSSTGLSLTNTQLKPQQSVERMRPRRASHGSRQPGLLLFQVFLPLW